MFKLHFLAKLYYNDILLKGEYVKSVPRILSAQANISMVGTNISHLRNVYNMSGRVVSDTQTRAEGESLYIRYNTDANVVNNLKNDSSYKFIGEVILKINVV